MSARELVVVVRRRWYVLAMVLLCTVVSAYVVHKRQISYEACDVLFVTAPPTHLNPNIYTNEAGSLDTMTGLVTRALMSSATQQQVRSAGVVGTYDAEMTNTGSNENPLFGEPSLQICSTATAPDMALRTTGAATRQYQAILRERQLEQNVPSKLLIGVSIVASPFAQPLYGRPSQALLGVGLIGLIAGFAVTLWSDPVLARRRLQRINRAKVAAGTPWWPSEV